MSTLSSLDVSYDPCDDVLTVEGVRYAGALFRDFASLLPLMVPFMLLRRENETIVIQRLPTTGEVNDPNSE